VEPVEEKQHDELPFDQWLSIHRLQYLLDQWSLIFDQGFSRSGRSGGEHLPLLPEIAHHPTIVELDRLLGELFLYEPVAYAHEKAYRVSVEWRLVTVMRPFRLPSGKKILREVDERQRLVPSWVNRYRVAEADAWLADNFDGEVFIPKPLWKALTEPARVA